jgi:hypothetical protein
VRPGDCAGDEWGSDCNRGAERSEVSTGSTRTWGPDETVWISGSVYVPQGFQTNTADTNIIQIKTSTNSAPNLPNPEPFSLSFSAGRLRAKLGWLDASRQQHIDKIDLGSVSQLEGRWTDFVIGSGPGTGNRFVVYLDGELILNEPTRYLTAQSFYLKYGIYRGAADYTNVLYWDEIRMGSSQAEVAIDESNPID